MNADEISREASSGRVDFVPAERFMAILTNEIIKQSETVDKCFPPGMDVMEPFLTRLGSDILAPYASYLFDEAYRRNKLAFVIAVPGYYNLCLRLQHSLRLSNYLDEHGLSSLQAVVSKLFQPKVELYLTTETATFKEVIGDAIDEWNEQVRTSSFHIIIPPISLSPKDPGVRHKSSITRV